MIKYILILSIIFIFLYFYKRETFNIYLHEKNSNYIYNKNEQYLKLMNIVNLRARNMNSVNSYNINDISKYQRVNMDNLLVNIKDSLKDSKLKKLFTKLFFTDKIIKIALSHHENGFPHTIKNVILFPGSFFMKFNFDRMYLQKTVIHETIHIIQRYNPEKFVPMIEDMGFIKIDTIKNFDDIYNLNRNNPDGLDINWLWKNDNKLYLISVQFNSTHPSSLGDVNNKYFIIEKHNDKYYYTGQNGLLSHLDPFMDYFNIYTNNYHPYEIISEFSENYYLENLKNNTFNVVESKGYNVFKKHIDLILDSDLVF